MKRNSSINYGYVIIIMASIVWSTMGIFGKLSFAYGINPVTLIALRLVISFIVLLIPLALFKRAFLHIHKKDWPILVLFGVFATAFQRLAYFYAIDLTTVTMAAILFYTYPIFVTFYASIVHKEKITVSILLALFLSLGGVFLVVRAYQVSFLSSNINGIISGLLSSFLFVLYFFITRKLRNTYTPWTLIVYGDGIGALVLLPVIIYNSSLISTFPINLWLLILAIACFPSLVGYLLYTYALKFVQASRASILSVVEPLSAALLSALILHESIESLQLLGIILALLGIIIARVKAGK